nr:topoisomerase C-terminal repeat-containing protein [Zoogloea sp.]
PKCSAQVYEHGLSYVCEKSVGPEKTCDFRSGKIILQQPIEREQMHKLLDSGRTELLRGFVSSRTKRKFSAFLVRGDDGKVGFEFEKKEPKAPAAGKAAAAKTAAVKAPAAKKEVAVKKAPAAKKPATRKKVAAAE